ncbi:GerAB/ArcD/ProY family transporter [Paenibacillus sp. strain BS8-2]
MVKSGQVAVLYVLIHIGVIFFLYPSNLLVAMESGHWIAVFACFILHIAVVWSYMWGLGRFEKSNVIDIFMRWSKWATLLIMTPVFLYLIVVAIISTRAYSEIISLMFLSSTPLWAIMILILVVSTYLAIQGIGAIFRTGVLLLLLCVPPLLFVLVSSFQHVDWHYLVPLYDNTAFSWSFLFNRQFLMSLIVSGGCFLFLGFIQPTITFDQRKIRYASLLLFPLMLIAVYVPLLTFGHSSASTFLFPFIMVTDIVEVNWLMFERASLFFTLSMIALILLYLSVILWNAIYMVQRMMKVSSLIIAAVLCLLVYIACSYITDWDHLQQLLWWNTLLRLYIMLVIPAGTLVLGILHHRKGGIRHASNE